MTDDKGDPKPAGQDTDVHLPLCVTLHEKISIPTSDNYPAQTAVFRARERSVGDDFITFLGLNLGDKPVSVEVDKDNVRGVVHLG